MAIVYVPYKKINSLPRHVQDRLTVPTFSKSQVNLVGIGGLDDVYGDRVVAHCVSNGTLTITWADGGTSDIAMLAGQTLGFDGTAQAHVDSGEFHVDAYLVYYPIDI